MNVQLDEKTQLLNFEQPENSRENEKEPWGTPKQGYKWYDSSTYASGSYGANSDSKNNKADQSTTSSSKEQNNNQSSNSDQGAFEMPSSVQKQEKFQITVHVDESKLVNHKFQLSIKNKDGQEVGMFDGQAPGVSSSVSPKIKNGVTDWYFKSKIANEADNEVEVEVLSGGNVIAKTTLNVQ